MRRRRLITTLWYGMLFSASGLVLVSMVLALWHSVGAIVGRYTITWPQVFGWFSVLTVGNVLISIAALRLRRKFTEVTHLIFILWTGIVIWYWTFAPAYYALIINLNQHQLAWAAFAFLWEVPVIGGGIFITIGVKLFRPILKIGNNPPHQELLRIYRRIMHYPSAIALWLFFISVIGYILGGVQLSLFAALPRFELVKSIANGPVVSIFLAVVYYLILDEFLDRYRGIIARSSQEKTLPIRRLRWRIAVISTIVMLGGLGLLGLLFVDSFQYVSEQRLQNELNRDLDILDQLESQSNPITAATLDLFRQGTRGQVIRISPSELPSLPLSENTIQVLQQQERGVVRDTQSSLKLIAFRTSPETNMRTVVITHVTDFYGFLEPQLLVPYVLGGLLIIAISIIILIFVAYQISRALEALRRFAENPKPQDWWRLPGVHTRDELELVGQTFMRFVQKAASFEHRLRKQVQQLETERLSLEHARARDVAILDSMGEGLVVTDDKGHIMLMNKKAETLLGRKINDVLGQSWLAIVKVSDDQGQRVTPAKAPLSEVLRTGKQMSTTNFHYTRADGSRFPVAVTLTALLYKKETLGVVLIFKDITWEKEIDRLKSEFVSLASHQLRSPLTTIKWYIDLLITGRDGILKPEQRRDLKRIERGNERMIRLVNHLLNVSRLESGRLAVNPVPTDLNEFLENVIGDTQAQAVETLCSVILVRDVANARVPIDPALLRQVLENLITNAMKYASVERDCRIVVRLLTNDKGEFNIRVEDNGIGIPQAEQKRVFEKFFRATNAAKQDTEGSGLGLYTCKLILNVVGCSISFSTKEGEGTIFTITIPKKGMRSKEGEIGLITPK